MIGYDEMLRVLAGKGGRQPGRLVCFAPFQGPDDDAATFVGEAGSLAEAFTILGGVVAGLVTRNEVPDLDAFRETLMKQFPKHAKAFAAIRSRAELLFAGAMFGFNVGIYELLESAEDAGSNVYVGGLLIECEGAEHVFAASAVPPHQDAAFAIMQINQTGAGPLSAPERGLAKAAAAGDLRALRRALDAGARVSAADERGMSALHHAVAHRKSEAVAVLLEAGAEPSLGATSNNSPMFAAVERKLVGPYLKKLRGKGHIKIISALLNAGASLDEVTIHDETLADIVPEIGASIEQIDEEE